VIYLNVNDKNEEFLFDSIILNYDFSTTNPIFFLNIYSLEGIAGNQTDRYIEFKSKFTNVCPVLNDTNFIVSGKINNTIYLFSLKDLICLNECLNSRLLYFVEYNFLLLIDILVRKREILVYVGKKNVIIAK
jgi:hypothetical protein